MRRLLKPGIPILILTSLLVWLWFATRPPRLSDEFMEGHYETYDGTYSVEFRGGRVQEFQQPRFPGDKAEMYTFGHYELSGTRITVTWEKKVMGPWSIDISKLSKYERLNEQEVLYYRKIGGVPVLLDEEDLSNFHSGQKIRANDYGIHVFTTTPGRAWLIGSNSSENTLSSPL